jgi:hypothetical protein
MPALCSLYYWPVDEEPLICQPGERIVLQVTENVKRSVSEHRTSSLDNIRGL